MTNKREVEALLDKQLTALQIAERLNCGREYVHATLRRNGWQGRVKANKRVSRGRQMQAEIERLTAENEELKRTVRELRSLADERP